MKSFYNINHLTPYKIIPSEEHAKEILEADEKKHHDGITRMIDRVDERYMIDDMRSKAALAKSACKKCGG